MRKRSPVRYTSALIVSGLAGSLIGGYWLMRYLQPRHSPLMLNGAVVVITGASSGIGRAYAVAMARRGARLTLVGRNVERLESLRLAIEPYAADVLIIPADITTELGRAMIIDGTLAHYGQIDMLINNAGVFMGGPLETAAIDELLNMIDVNFSATIALTRLVLPSLLTRGSGLIVNVSSATGRVAMPGSSVYSATKHAIMGLSTALRRELNGTGVGVVAVLPGFVRTDMLTSDRVSYLERVGIPLSTPEAVAEQTINGLLNGQSEIYLGGPVYRAVMWTDRHFPALMSLAWRVAYTPEWIEAMRSKSAE